MKAKCPNCGWENKTEKPQRYTGASVLTENEIPDSSHDAIKAWNAGGKTWRKIEKEFDVSESTVRDHARLLSIDLRKGKAGRPASE